MGQPLAGRPGSMVAAEGATLLCWLRVVSCFHFERRAPLDRDQDDNERGGAAPKLRPRRSQLSWLATGRISTEPRCASRRKIDGQMTGWLVVSKGRCRCGAFESSRLLCLASDLFLLLPPPIRPVFVSIGSSLVLVGCGAIRLLTRTTTTATVNLEASVVDPKW